MERAFELAKSGRFRTTSEIKTRLRKEGYFSDAIGGYTLISHLNALMRMARTAAEQDPTADPGISA
jgi:hypothetical protein